jgi:predicted CXXCH cytochrome family protein
VARSQRKSRKKKSGSRRSTARPSEIAEAEERPRGRERGLLSRQGILVGSLLAAGLVLIGGLTFQRLTGDAARQDLSDASPAVAFVGSETCAGCHRAQAELWRRSQHKHAMDHATEKSVLGDFSDVTFDYYGVRSRFFRNGGRFQVETDGPDGKLATFEIKYTFGVDPLQQYLIQFPDGRLQALSIAWDCRPKEVGGQRWFHLYPNEKIGHDDVLHWTKLNQNWNFMCAECHSTGVRKNYDAASNRFATTFAEISVGCEACHGQGSRHVGWARDRKSWWPFGKTDDPAKGLIVLFDERSNVTWPLDPKTGNATRSTAPATLRKEVETCGLCHARRGQFSENWLPGRWLSDTHTVSLIGRGLYHADGQMLDEVYNYGSFKQSRMFAAGVTCSDCHEPHSAKLRASGDGVCLQCHAPDKYAAVAHHRHEGISPPLGCASCHMPARTYMVVDRRHDHSFRIPRPDLSVKFDTPNACNDCHADKSPEWAASAIERWHGPNRKGFQNYAAGLHAAWTGQADAATLLAEIATDRQAPAIARATSLSELGSRFAPLNINLAQKGLADPDPMVRIGALDMLEGVPLAQRWPLASAFLADDVQGVRIRAASLLAGVPNTQLTASDRQRFGRAAEEFIAAQKLNADRPEARSMLGSFYAQRGATAEAETEYRAALRLSHQYTPAAINLADLYRRLQREADGENVLRSAIAAVPQDAGVHHALGLTLVRLKRLDEALAELRLAAELAPDQARYAYVYAVALHSAGRGSEAMTALEISLARHPNDRDTLLALISFSRDAGEPGTALEYAERLARIAPTDPNISGLTQQLRRQLNETGPR